MSSISQEYTSLIKQIKTQVFKSPYRQDSKEFQDVLTSIFQKMLTFKHKIFTELAFFSDNESLEDLSSASLKYIGIDYHLGYLMSKKQAVLAKGTQSSSFMLSSKNKLKLEFLNKSVQLYMQFLVTLNDYEILDKTLAKRLSSFKLVFKPTLDEITNKNVPNSQAFQRELKIESFKIQRTLEAQLANLEQNLREKYGSGDNKNKEDGDDDDYLESGDDELLRELYLAQLTQLSHRAFAEVEGDLYEIDMLNNFTSMNAIDEHQESIEKQMEDDKNKRSKDPTKYTEKLEVLNQPLLSKTGKVLRNFTLLDNKQKLQNKVFGFGQYGPTMSVDEFLEEEFANGNVLQGGGEDPSMMDDRIEEDSESWADKETYKAREWDAFTEANSKGSGNTMNRG